jgi:hypothetical protein
MGTLIAIAGLVLSAFGLWIQHSDTKAKTNQELAACSDDLSACRESRNAWIVALLVLVTIAFLVGRYQTTAS